MKENIATKEILDLEFHVANKTTPVYAMSTTMYSLPLSYNVE